MEKEKEIGNKEKVVPKLLENQGVIKKINIFECYL